MRALDAIGHALAVAGSMTWQITWSLILGFTLSAVVQAVVRRQTVARLLGQLYPRTSGQVRLHGEPVTVRGGRRYRPRKSPASSRRHKSARRERPFAMIHERRYITADACRLTFPRRSLVTSALSLSWLSPSLSHSLRSYGQRSVFRARQRRRSD